MSLLSRSRYDVLVVGGGILGACVFWEAGLRGLSAALVEQHDFASATSANSLKIIHGGLRYLQQADFRRMRASTNERTILMRIAPHLVHPMPVLIPTYGHGKQGKEILGLAMRINDLVSYDRNRSVSHEKRIPNGRVLSKHDTLELLPDLPTQGLTGAAQFYDAQVYNSERLVLAFLKSAAQIGGDLANYAKVVDFSFDSDQVVGANVRDQLTGDCFNIQAKMIVNCAGPWTPKLRRKLPGATTSSDLTFTRGINIVTRALFGNVAVGLKSGESNSRLLFTAPWRGYSIIGTHYSYCDDDPSHININRDDVDDLLDQINTAYPSAQLSREDVKFVHRGLLPATSANGQVSTPRLAQHPTLIDHRQDGIGGLLSAVSVKYTTARHVAVGIVDRIFAIWNRESMDSASATTRLRGGEMHCFSDFLERELSAQLPPLSRELLTQLICNYGSDYAEVLAYLPAEPWEMSESGELKAMLTAQIYHAVHKEMAIKLTDVIFRRSDLASAYQPDSELVSFCARTMGQLLKWEDKRILQEIDEVNDVFSWKQ